jgi:hypothetical protein
MTEIAARMPSGQVLEISDGGHRPAEEIAEAGISGPNNSPDDSQNNDRPDDIAAPDIQRNTFPPILKRGRWV